MPLLPALRQALTRRLLPLAEGASAFVQTGVLGLSSVGSGVALLAGRLALAVVLGTVALGLFLRLSGRPGREAKAAPPAPSSGQMLGCGLLSALETAVLVEAIDLPVRFHQPGFEPHHWLWVLLAGAVLFLLQLRLLRRLARGRPQG